MFYVAPSGFVFCRESAERVCVLWCARPGTASVASAPRARVVMVDDEDEDEGPSTSSSRPVVISSNVIRALTAVVGRQTDEQRSNPTELARARDTLERALVDAFGDGFEIESERDGRRCLETIAGVLTLPRRGAHEGVTTEAVRALRSACALGASGTRDALRKTETAPTLGFVMSTLISIAHEETMSGSKALRAIALETLDGLIRTVNDADALAFFLPGVVSGLTKALAAASGVRPNVGAGPGGAGSEGVEFALSSLGSILTCVLNDSLYEEFSDLDASANLHVMSLADIVKKSTQNGNEKIVKNHDVKVSREDEPPTHVESSERDFRVIRHGEWLRNAALRVEAAVLMTIPPLVRNERASVRLQSAKTAARIIQNCSHVLGKKVRRRMMECVLTAAGDDWPQVSKPIMDELKSLDTLGRVFREDLEAIVKEDLFKFADTLRDSCAPAAAGHVRCLLIALDFMGPVRVKEILLENLTFRELLCSTIVECLLIENHTSKRIRAGQSLRLIDLSEASVPTARTLPRKPTRLQYFAVSGVYEDFAKVLRLLGAASAITTDVSPEAYLVPTAQFFLNSLRDNGEQLCALATTGMWQRNATAHIVALNEMMYGAINEKKVDKKYLVQFCGLVVEEYACSQVWDIDTMDQDNALLLCQLMEGFGIVGEALGADYIRNTSLLATVLCPLLDKLGDDSTAVRDTAALVLLTLARSGEYDSVNADHSAIGNLVIANADYVIDMVSRQMRHMDTHHRAPRLFAALLRRTDAAKSMVKLLAEPVQLAAQTFLISNRERTQSYAEGFLVAMKEYCSAVLLEVRDIEKCSRNVVERLQIYHPEEPDSDDELSEVFVEQIQKVLPDDLESTQSSSLERVRRIQSMVCCASELLRCISAILESPDTGNRSLAALACGLGIESLAAAESALRHEKYILKVLKAYGGKGSLPFDIAELYKEARVLPHVHNIWPHVVLSLSSRYQLSTQFEAFEASLKLVHTLAFTSGGDFIAKRTHAELWPIFARILTHGVRHSDNRHRSLDLLTIADTVDTDFIPDQEVACELTKNVRISICRTLETIAASENSRDALRDLVAESVPIIAKLAVEGGSALRSAASRTIRAFANVNGDEVWLYLVKTIARAGACIEVPTPTWGPGRAGAQVLPSVSEIVPRYRTNAEKRQSGELQFALSTLNSLAL